MNSKRLYFIDAVRAFAILMMLQGHFIDTLLNPIYRDTSYMAYNIWSYFRGITAPTFFTITGLVFTYLLFKAKEKGVDKERLKKGFRRGFMLIGLGYLLRISFLDWFSGYFNTYFLVIDVLQCIGLSLLILLGLYVLTKKNKTTLGIVLLIIGVLTFLTEPLYRTIKLESVPKLIANYMTMANGSIFNILPWFGYVAFGGIIALLFLTYSHKENFRKITIAFLLIVGLFLINYSTTLLFSLYDLTQFELLNRCANWNYLYVRLGNVLVLFAIFFAFENYLKRSIITNIGEKTLSIYVIHFILLYGSFTGFGLKRFLNKSLEPWEAVIGAILFMIVVCFIVFNLGKTNTFIYTTLNKLIEPVKKAKKKVGNKVKRN